LALLSSFFSLLSASLRYFHSFPTRRSSDLVLYTKSQFDINSLEALGVIAFQSSVLAERADSPLKTVADLVAAGQDKEITYSSARSEEHTSELQSRENLVCRLLLEKKK